MTDATDATAMPRDQKAPALLELAVRILALWLLVSSISSAGIALQQSASFAVSIGSLAGKGAGLGGDVAFYVAIMWVTPVLQIFTGILLLRFARRIACFLGGGRADIDSAVDLPINASGAYRIGIALLGCYSLMLAIRPLIQFMVLRFQQSGADAASPRGAELFAEGAAYIGAGILLISLGRKSHGEPNADASDETHTAEPSPAIRASN